VNGLKDKFLLKAEESHGTKYDYSLVDYKNNKTKIKIICPEHGVFEQTPGHHVNNNNGCKKCSDERKRFDNLIFINNAIKIHGDKYDYSLVNYIGSNNKVKIICPEHGLFEQTPVCHTNGKRGCDKCGGTSTSTTDEFILKARKIHGDKYDYSNTKYISGRKKVKIICNVHGEFEQSPDSHLMNKGCSRCAMNFKLTTDDFIKRSNNNIYNYDLSIVGNKNNREKIKICCPHHGIFEQVIHSHLNGHGCPLCKSSKGENKISNQKLRELIFRDEIKNQFCKINNINLLRINFNENIEEKLKNNIINYGIDTII
jgi:hypothetical protein